MSLNYRIRISHFLKDMTKMPVVQDDKFSFTQRSDEKAAINSLGSY
jgi:hypothetical protein